jgi:hypothetical protein
MLPIPVILVFSMFLVFNYLGLRIFYGTRGEALNALGTIVQGLSAIIAIVFALILVVVQTTLGKYVTKTVQYIVLNWLNFLVLTLYLGTIMIALFTMWIIDREVVSTWVDVTMVMTTLCIGSLIPFFITLPRFLRLTNIMNQIKDEVLDACQEKNYGLMTSKTNLLVNTIKKSLEVGEEEYAFEGARYIEEIIKKEDYREQRWMFFSYILYLLDDLGTRSLGRNPNYTLRILEVYGKMLQKLQDIPPVFHSIATSIVQSTMNLCRDSRGTKVLQPLAWKSYYLILDVYKTDILLGYSPFSAIDLDPSLRQVLKYYVDEGISERVGFSDFITNKTILELLKKEKQSEALHLFQIIFEETPKTRFALLGVISLIKDSKTEGFDSFASSAFDMVKQNFRPLSFEIIYDPKLGGRSELSVSPENKVVLKTGKEKEKEALLWIKQQAS